MAEKPPASDIKGYECKHVSYTTAKDGSEHDIVAIKEVIHYKDGTTKPNLRFIVDYKRPFYITKEGHRNHAQKKEWEDAKKLQRFESTQISMPDAIYRSLHGMRPGRPMRLREVCRSPYVYGADVTTPVLIKRYYMDRFPEVNGANGTPYTVTNLDTETDMVMGTEEILMASVTFGPKVHLIVSKKFLGPLPNAEQELRRAFHYYLGKDGNGAIERLGATLTIEIVDEAVDVSLAALRQIHAWQPDIVAIWNMDFDIPKMAHSLEKAGYDLGELFADPKIPPPFKKYVYHQGSSQKVTQSGKTMPLPYFDRWHSVECPASYQVLDAMCLYRKLRFAKGMEDGYGLDAVLKRKGLGGKLKFKEADHVTGAQWHAFMQANYKVEYCIYNIWDSLSMYELDEQTGDLSRQIGLHSGHSEFNRFPSQPRRTWDDMHFECLEHGVVAATTSDKLRDEFDDMTASLQGWIVTLPSHQVADTGLKAIAEVPDYSTLIWVHVADLDVEGTYPNTEALMNISRKTTSCELVKIEGIDDRTQRSIGINLTGGHVNAVELCTRVYKAPTFDTLLADYQAAKEGRENEETILEWVDDFSGEQLEEEGLEESEPST